MIIDICGLQVSGLSLNNSLWTFKENGHDLITGGQFGPEGGIITTAILIVFTILILKINLKRNKIIHNQIA